MHIEILSAAQVRILERLASVPEVSTFYLAGGTALALRHGHRRSIDFDFFRASDLDAPQLLRTLDAEFDDLERVPTDPSALYVLIDGVTTSFFAYHHTLLTRGDTTPWGFDLASDDDIAAMKLEAVAGRGSRKDFIDLRILCRAGYTMENVFELYDRKYGTRRTSRYHRIRALSYFADAESEPMPEMLVEFSWQEAVEFFTAEAARLVATLAP